MWCNEWLAVYDDKFIAESVGESILKINWHLANLQAVVYLHIY